MSLVKRSKTKADCRLRTSGLGFRPSRPGRAAVAALRWSVLRPNFQTTSGLWNLDMAPANLLARQISTRDPTHAYRFSRITITSSRLARPGRPANPAFLAWTNLQKERITTFLLPPDQVSIATTSTISFAREPGSANARAYASSKKGVALPALRERN